MPKWTLEEEKILQNLYGKVKITEIAKLVPNHTIGGIQKWATTRLNLHGNQHIAQQVYSFNEHYFDIPTIENSYWAGYIAADGSLCKKGSITLQIALKDKIILDSFINDIQFSGPIKIFKDKRGFSYTRLSIWGTFRLHKFLNEYWNIVECKSNILQPPNITDLEQIYSFITGYFDGDGCAYFSKDRFFFGFCGTELMMRWIDLHLTKLYPYIKNRTIHNNGAGKINKRIMWSSKSGKLIYSKLYDSVKLNFRLPRKWQFVEQFKKELYG